MRAIAEPQPTKGLAKANSMARPTPIRKAASIRPTSRNILVCRVFISSGWRAEASRYFPPIMPMPMQAPMAPRPMIRPQARATNATLVMTTPWLITLCNQKSKIDAGPSPRTARPDAMPGRISLVAFVGLAHVDQRQHHEDECLQQYDQNMEDRPGRTRNHVPEGQADAAGVQARPGTAQERDQHEQQLARVHVPEQPHAQRNALGGVFDQVQ